MTVGHERLLEYLLDLLSAAERAEVEMALARDDTLRTDLTEVRDALDGLSDVLAPVAPTAGRRAVLLEAVTPRLRFEWLIEPLTRLLDVSLERVKAILAEAEDLSRWEASPWDGVRLFHLQGGPATVGADVGFVHVEAGQAFPYHEHVGDERVLVLQGGFESDGEVFEAGDVDERGAGSRHGYVALEGPDLVYAVVLFGGIEFPSPPSG